MSASARSSRRRCPSCATRPARRSCATTWTDAPAHPRGTARPDAEAIVAARDAAWRESYRGIVADEVLHGLDAAAPVAAERWRERLANGSMAWIAVDDDEIVGVTLAAPRSDEDRDAAGLVELRVLYVRQHLKGTGLAGALLTYAIGDAPAYLWVFEANQRAIAFYRRHGFAPDGTRHEETWPGGPPDIRLARS